MTLTLKVTLLSALLALGACSSTPITFHTLTPAQWSNSTGTDAGGIKIESISVPPQVDRPPDCGSPRQQRRRDPGYTVVGCQPGG